MIGYFLLGVSALPNMQFPAIFVQASQAGADASTMASTVAAPLERHLGQVPGIETMRSSSSEGRTFVFMMFRNGTDRSEEHTSELQSLMRTSYAVYCLKN